MISVHFNNLCKILAVIFLLLFSFSFSLQANQLDENEVGRVIINNFDKSKIIIDYSHITRPEEDKILFHDFSYRRKNQGIPTKIGNLVLDGISYDKQENIYRVKSLYFINDEGNRNIKIEIYKNYMMLDDLIINNVYFSEKGNDDDGISASYEFDKLKIKEFSVFSHNENPIFIIKNIKKSYSADKNKNVHFSIEDFKIYLSNILKDFEVFQPDDDILKLMEKRNFDNVSFSVRTLSFPYMDLISHKRQSKIEIESQDSDKLIFTLETGGINEYFKQSSNEDPLSLLNSEEILLALSINSNHPSLFLENIEISYKNNSLFQNIMELFMDINNLSENDFLNFVDLRLNDVFLKMEAQDFGKKHISCINKLIEKKDEISLYYEFSETSRIGSLYQFIDVILNHDDPIVGYDVDNFLNYNLKNFQCKT